LVVRKLPSKSSSAVVVQPLVKAAPSFGPFPNRLCRLALIIFMLLVTSACSFALPARGQRVQGVVTAPSGIAVADAVVTLENKRTRASLTTRTSKQGGFSIGALKPGKYEITVQAAGSKPFQREFLLAPGPIAGEMLSIRLIAESSSGNGRVPGDFVQRAANPIALLTDHPKSAAGVAGAVKAAADTSGGLNPAASFSIYSPVISPSPIGFGFSESDGGGIDENEWQTDNGASAYDARLPLAATQDGTDTTFIATDANNAVGTDFYDSVVTGYFVGAQAVTYRFTNNAWTLLRSDTITGYTSVPGSTAAADHTITFAASGPATQAGDVVWIKLDDTLGQIPLYDVAYRSSQFPTYCLDWQTDAYPATGGCFPLNPTAPSAYSVPLPYEIVADSPGASDVSTFGSASQFTNATSLEITDPNSEQQAIKNYVGYYTCGVDEQFQSGHTYELGVWLKGATSDGTVSVGYTEFAGTFYGNQGIGQTFTGVNQTWQYYTWDFPAPACVPSGNPVVTFTLSYNAPGTLEENGLHIFDKTYPVYSLAAPVIPAVQQAWNDYKPSTMRLWSGFSDSAGGYQYWSLDSWLDPEWQGRTSPQIGNFYTTDQIALHLPAALAATKQAGANPWLIVQMSYSAQEWSNLIDYLASPAGSTPYSLKRPASHPGPYTDDFPIIYLEVGNEEWGTQQTPVNFAYGQWVHYVATAATTGKSYATQEQLLSQFKFITNGFFLQPSFASGAIAQAPESTIVDYALYNSGDTSLTGDDYYQSDLVQLPVTNQSLIDSMVSQQKIDSAQGHPYTLAAYESGPGADVPAHNGDPSLAAATATMDVDLYAQLRGFNPINFFLFGEGTGPYTSHTNFAAGFLPHPVWEASQMRNLYLNGDMVWTVPGTVPTVTAPDNGDTYPAISAYSFHDVNNQVDIAILSRDFYNTTPVTITFPGTPTGTANYYSLVPPQGGDPSATNDTELDVPINSQVLTGVTQSYTIDIAPGSFNILQVPISGNWSTNIPAPAAPTSLAAHANNGSVQLSWATVDGASSYNILRGLTPGGESATPIGTTSGAGYVDSSVTNGTLYYYVVTAANVGGTSGPSNEVSATPNVAIAATSTPPLDGSDTGAWTSAPSYPLLHDFNTYTSDTASYKVLWDTNYLYVLASVQDATLVAPTEANVFTGDSVEVYFSGTDTASSSYGPTDFQYAFPYGNGGAVPTESHHNAIEGVIEGQQIITGGYQLAIAIPWTTLGTTPVANKQYGFDVMVNDATSQGVRDGKLAWWGTVDETYTNPSLMGPLVLSPNGNLPASNTTLSVTPAGPYTPGQEITLTSTVTPATGKGVPTGTVTFDIAGPFGKTETVALNAKGEAVHHGTAPLSGSYTFTATYSGSSSLSGSVSPSLPETVTGIPTSVAISVNPDTNLVYGEPYSITATVTSQNEQDVTTGTVAITVGAITKTIAVGAGGIATYTGTAPVVGVYSVGATYSGTPTFAGSEATPYPITIGPTATTTAFSVSPTSGFASGAPWTLTATVTDNTGAKVPSGSVTFNIAGPHPKNETVNLNADGVATHSGIIPPDGSYSLSATYNGATNFAGSVSTSVPVVIEAKSTPTTTSLTQSPTSNLQAGASWTLTASVIPTSGNATPTGTVTFVWDLGKATVPLGSTGTAVYYGTVPAIGTHNVYATYNGSGTLAPSTSNTIDFTSTGVSTTTSLSINPSGTVITGQPLSLTAVVTPASGTSVATGSVTFSIGTTTKTVPLDNTGKAVYPTTAPAPNTYPISASYGGSATLSGSAAAAVNEIVTGVPTTTVLTVNPANTVVSGSPWSLTAVVTANVGTAVPTGSVTFQIGSTTQTVALDSTGKAVYSGAAPAINNYSLTASYSGAATFAPSVSALVSESVTGTPTTTVLSISPSLTLAAGEPVVLSATVSAAGSGTAPGGSVSFSVGSSNYSAALNSSGVATYSGTAPGAGTYSVTASYPGSASFAPSASATTSISVVAAGTAIPIAIPNYSFEQGGVGYNVPTNWSFVSSSNVAGDYALQQISNSTSLAAEDGSDYWAPSDFNSSTAPYGPTTATLTTSSSLGTFQANTGYTLTVALADPADGTDPSLKSVGFQLLANGVPVQTFASSSLTPGANFADYSLNFYTSSNPSVVGQSITIALVYTYSGQYNRQAFFDNVRLTQTYGATQPLLNTITVLSVSPNNSILVSGTPYTLTAVVSGTGTSDIPTGNVVFTIGSATQSVALDSTGTATYNGTVPAVGSYAISAAYGGSSEFNPSTSNTLNESVVSPGTPIPIPIPNYSFEQGGAGYNVPNNWTFVSSGADGDYSVQYISNSTSPPAVDGSDYWAPGDFNQGTAPYGTSTATLTTSASLGTFAANTTYALTVALAIPADGDSSYKSVGLQILSNGVPVATLPAATLTEGANFTDFSVSFDTASNAAVAGQNITVALLYTYTGPYNRSAYFDNVRLTQVADIAP
jgi:hypothetical protein